jgi:hypothetical protein
LWPNHQQRAAARPQWLVPLSFPSGGSCKFVAHFAAARSKGEI